MKMEWVGRIDYLACRRIQEERLDDCLTHGEESVILLEHEPVYTIGRLLDKSSLRAVDHLPYPVFETNRGGQATYHGPGQLVGYPILDLRARGRDLHGYLRKLEDLLIDLLEEFGIAGSKIDGKTGVWVQDRKIASIGVGVRRWITMHAFALNVASDPSGCLSIVPCGISGVQMTSISKESGAEISLETVREKLFPYLRRSLDAGAFALPPKGGNVA
jgi:lipoyl(octanoyl) transferase